MSTAQTCVAPLSRGNYVRLASRASSRVGVYLFVTRMMHVPKLIPLVRIVCYSTVHRIVTLGTTALDGATHAESGKSTAAHDRPGTARPGRRGGGVRHGRRGAPAPPGADPMVCG